MEIISVMKTIFSKLKIHEATYLLFLIFLLTGHIKNIFIIFLIVLFHELGHVFWLKHFHYEINQIEILPFGGLTKTNKLVNTPISHDILIYLGGVSFQFLLYIFFILFNHFGIIYFQTYQMFLTYNTAILIFNLLPIRPLDGGEIMRLGLEKYFSFYQAQKLSNFLSFFFLFLFFLSNITFNLNNYLICSFLLVKLYELVKIRPILQNKFYLERLFYTFPYTKIRHEKKKKLNMLKKDTWHYFPDGQKIISEKKLLKEKFDILSHF